MSKLINCKYDTIRVFKCKSSKNYTAKIQHYKKICIQENKNAFIVCSEDNNRRQCGIRVYVQRRNGDFSERDFKNFMENRFRATIIGSNYISLK